MVPGSEHHICDLYEPFKTAEKNDQILSSRNVMKRHRVEEEAVQIPPDSNVTSSACFEQ